MRSRCTRSPKRFGQMAFGMVLSCLALCTMGVRVAEAAIPGTLDPLFNATNGSGGRIFTEQSDGKLVISGNVASTVPSYANREFLRYLSDGTFDTQFQASGTQWAEVAGHVLRPDDRVMLYGSFAQFSGHPTMSVALLKLDGTVDTSFKLTLPSPATATSLVLAGSDKAYVNYSDGRVIRVLLADGSIDPTFVLDPSVASLGSPFSMATQPSGKLLLLRGGKVTRVLENGAKDTSYIETSFAWSDPAALASGVDGSLYLGATTGKLNGGELRNLIKLKPEGGIDPGFKFNEDGTSAGSRTISRILLQPDGKLLVYGQGFRSQYLFRVLTDGNADTNFFGAAMPTAMGLDRSARILFTGTYISLSPLVIKSGLLRLANDGIPEKPLILSQPQSQTVDAGSSVVLSVSAVGAGPLSYQWRHAQSDIPGATNRSLALTSVSGKDGGEYQVQVTNPQGTLLSSTAILIVNSAPRIVRSPLGLTGYGGDLTQLVAQVVGEVPLSLQWHHQDSLVPGANDSTLPLGPLTSADAGSYYLTASNAYGSATTTVAQVIVFPSSPSWLVVTNGTDASIRTNLAHPFRPDVALKVLPDYKRGVVLGYVDGIERWNDEGTRMWSLKFVPVTEGTLRTFAVDRDGNTYVTGSMRSTAKFGTMNLTNTSIDKPTIGFLAKFDIAGNGLWYRMLEGFGINATTVAFDGNVVMSGTASGVSDEIRIGTLRARRYPEAEALCASVSADGTPRWLKTFNQVDFQVSTCTADTIAADETGIYISGLYSFSIAFGTNQLHKISGPPAYWLGKLSTNGEPQWLRAPDGDGRSSDQLVAAHGNIWFAPDALRAVQHWTPSGVMTGAVPVVTFSANDSARGGQLSVNSRGEPAVTGTATGTLFVSTNQLFGASQRQIVWFAQWDGTGHPLRARVLSATTNDISGSTQSSISVNTSAMDADGNLYSTGVFNGGVRIQGHLINDLARSYLCKHRVPALSPEVLSQTPVFGPGVLWDAFSPIHLQAAYTGAEPITLQWRKNGIPILGATNATFDITSPLPVDNGLYDIQVSNAWGSISTDIPLNLVVRPPIQFSQQPASQLVILGAEMPPSEITGLDIRPSMLVGKTIHATITNASGRWTLGEFDVALPSNSKYSIPAGGVLGAHGGFSSIVGLTPELTDLRFFSFYNTNTLSASLSLMSQGQFSFHVDSNETDGCCALGLFSLRGGPKSATFIASFNGPSLADPELHIQWQHDGVDVPTGTNYILSLPAVSAADAGTYRCTFSYKGYTAQTEPAFLRLGGAGSVITPPILGFTPPAPGATSLQFSWPAGFTLQHATTLTPPNWSDVLTSSPATLPIAQPGEFFRLIQSP